MHFRNKKEETAYHVETLRIILSDLNKDALEDQSIKGQVEAASKIFICELMMQGIHFTRRVEIQIERFASQLYRDLTGKKYRGKWDFDLSGFQISFMETDYEFNEEERREIASHLKEMANNDLKRPSLH